MMKTSHSISSDIFRFELTLFPIRRGRICCDDGDEEEGDIEKFVYRRGVEGANTKEELGRIRRVCAPISTGCPCRALYHLISSLKIIYLLFCLCLPFRRAYSPTLCLIYNY